MILRAAEGNPSAIRGLLDRYRERLKRMVASRMDPRIAARFDPSDIVQDTLMQASNRLPQYFKQQTLPFYPWLRGLAWDRIVQLHRLHIKSQKRSVNREQPLWLNDQSASDLADRLAGSMSDPAEKAIREETRHRVRAALELLKPEDREILTLRYFEQLETGEIAAVLGIREGTVNTRHFRAIRRLQRLLES